MARNVRGSRPEPGGGRGLTGKGGPAVDLAGERRIRLALAEHIERADQVVLGAPPPNADACAEALQGVEYDVNIGPACGERGRRWRNW